MVDPTPQGEVGGVPVAFNRADAARMLRLLAHDEALLAIHALQPPHEQRYQPDTIDAALSIIERFSGKRPVYAVLNPIKPDTAGTSTRDENILCLRWFPLDADPVRPADTASTKGEKEEAFSVMDSVVTLLTDLLPSIEGSILRADSGNGAHTLLRLPDYPVSETARLKMIGDALCRRFSTDLVHMDQTIYNPSRIWRVYGTINVKGGNTADRPHRMAAILPDQPDPVPFDLLAHWDSIAGALDPQPARRTLRAPTEQPFGASIAGQRPLHELPPWWSEPVLAGGRNNAAFRRARWLVNGSEGGFDKNDAWEQLRAWNRVCCRPPLGEAELRKVLDSAVDDGDNPAFVSPVRPYPRLEWPVIAEKAFYGLAGEIVRAIEPHTEADPIALLMHILVAFGSAIGRNVHFIADGARHGGNEFAVLVGTTSKGRKGTSWGHPRRLFEQADPTWAHNRILSGLSSGEGLIYNVRDAIEKLERDKKTGEYNTVIVDEGVDDKRLLAFEGEFTSVLRQTGRDGNTLSATLRNAWDGTKLQSLVKNNPTRATEAHISIIGHITCDEVRKELSETESANGFGNRFLWALVKRSKCLPDGGAIETVNLTPLICRLQEAIDYGRNTGQLVRDDQAREIWHAVYPELSEGKPGLLGAMTARAEAHVVRLSLLYALLDCTDAISADHLIAALALWEYCEASARTIFGDSLGDRNADEILRALRAAPEGLSRSEISNLLGRNMSSSRIGQSLALLAANGLARIELIAGEAGGRPSEHWHATKYTK